MLVTPAKASASPKSEEFSGLEDSSNHLKPVQRCLLLSRAVPSGLEVLLRLAWRPWILEFVIYMISTGM